MGKIRNTIIAMLALSLLLAPLSAVLAEDGQGRENREAKGLQKPPALLRASAKARATNTPSESREKSTSTHEKSTSTKERPKPKKNVSLKGEVTLVNHEAKTFDVKDKDKVYKVVVNDKTVFLRRFFGRTNFGALSVGDKVAVNGRAEEDGTIVAKQVRDLSTWKVSIRQLQGVLKALNSSDKSFTMRRGDGDKDDNDQLLTIKTSNETKLFVQEKGGWFKKLSPAAFDKLMVNDRVRVSGILNKNLLTVEADTVVIIRRGATTSTSSGGSTTSTP